MPEPVPRPSRSVTTPQEYSSMSPSEAIVASEPAADHHGGDNWAWTEIRVPTNLNDGELLVEIVATGICHTDISVTSPNFGQTFPIVPGHEGSGYVRAVGPNVKKALQPGDPVLLSFDSCTACQRCQDRDPAYCDQFVFLNLYGQSDVFKGGDENSAIGGKFFGQSCFSKLTIVKETTVLAAKGLIETEDELKLFAPLGCGIQTGAGSILNMVKAGPEDRVMVCGLGGVGLSAIMGAHIAGCKQIIAVDRVEERMELAKSFGATHSLNTTDLTNLTAAMKEIAGGRGPTIVIEATGVPVVIESSYLAVDTKGTFVQLAGSVRPGWHYSIDLAAHLFRGIKLWGCVEGDSYPETFIPELINYYRQGKLPVDKMVKYYSAKDFKTAVQDMHSGKTIKPILIW